MTLTAEQINNALEDPEGTLRSFEGELSQDEADLAEAALLQLLIEGMMQVGHSVEEAVRIVSDPENYVEWCVVDGNVRAKMQYFTSEGMQEVLSPAYK